MILGLKKSTQLAFCLVVANARLQYAGMNGACDLTYWEHLHSKSMKNVQSKSIIFLWALLQQAAWNAAYLHWGHLSGIPWSLLWSTKDFNLGERGGREEKEEGRERQHAHNERATHPVRGSTDWLTMWEPKAWLTSSNYDGWYQLQLGVGGHTFLGSNI